MQLNAIDGDLAVETVYKSISQQWFNGNRAATGAATTGPSINPTALLLAEIHSQP